jgi:hypothetical protein
MVLIPIVDRRPPGPLVIKFSPAYIYVTYAFQCHARQLYVPVDVEGVCLRVM